MHRVVVSINNRKNTNFIISLLKKFDFVKFELDGDKLIYPSPLEKGDWTDLIGIWKDNDITLERIREKAWPNRI